MAYSRGNELVDHARGTMRDEHARQVTERTNERTTDGGRRGRGMSSVRRRRTRTETEDGEGWRATSSTNVMTPKRRSGRREKREERVGKDEAEDAKKRGVGVRRRPLDAVVAVLAVVWL